MKNGTDRIPAKRFAALLLCAALLSAPSSPVSAYGEGPDADDWFERDPTPAEPAEAFSDAYVPDEEFETEEDPVPLSSPILLELPEEPEESDRVPVEERNPDPIRRRTAGIMTDGEPEAEEEEDEAGSQLPTLFRNDEAWYKDSMEPLLVRSGEPYVPADFFGMFASVSYSLPKEDNLLLSNSVTGGYVSILTDDGSSAVNGEIGDTVGVFRDGNVWYVEAGPVSEALGLGMETISEKNGVPTLRITDGNERLTAARLIALFNPETQTGQRPETEPEPEPAKRLFIFCTSPEESTEYSIEAELERFDMDCTVFLWHDATLTQMLAGQSYGAYGVATTDEENTAGALTEADRRIRELTMRRTRWTLTTQDPEEDRLLRDAGFCPITPDFTVNNLTALDSMMADLEATLDEKNEVSVFLTDRWKGTVAVSLLRALLDNHPDWAETNLGG